MFLEDGISPLTFSVDFLMFPSPDFPGMKGDSLQISALLFYFKGRYFSLITV